MADIVEAVTEELGVELKSRHEAGPLKRLLDDGLLQRYAVLEGVEGEWQKSGAYTYRVPDLDDVSLKTVWEVAVRHVAPKDELDLEPGRKSTATAHASRKVLAVHEGQIRTIRAALTKTVEHMVPSARRQPGDSNDKAWGRIVEAMAQIGAPQLVWAEGGGAHGLGDWAVLQKVEDATRRLAPSSRHKYVGAIRTLLDLGASHGFLLRKDVHGAKRSYLPAAWARTLEKWESIVRESTHTTRSQGTAHLSRIMAAVADFFGDRLDEIDPMRLTEEQSIAFGNYFAAHHRANTTMSNHHRTCTLAALRALMDAGVMSDVPITDFDRRRIDGRKNAFECGAYKAIAREFCFQTRRKDANYGLFRELGAGAFFDPDNPYSLPRLVDWYTLIALRHRRSRELGGIKGFPRDSVRGTGGLSGRPWTEKSIEYHLEILGMYLGWLQTHQGFDLEGDDDARTLFSIDLLDEFVDAVEEDGWTTPYRALEVIKHTALYCSPCWESLALEEEDVEAADRFQAVADYANGRGRLTKSGRYDHQNVYATQTVQWAEGRSDNDRIENQKAQARAVQRVYETASGLPYAYLAMLEIRNAAIARFCRESGASDLEELRRKIEGGYVQPDSEFCLVRNIAVVGMAIAAPHRRSTVAALDRSDFRETAAGVLWTNVVSHKFKVTNNGEFELKLADRAAVVGDMSFRWDLWDFYDVCRTARLGTATSDVMILSSSPRKMGEDPFRLTEGSITGLYTKVIEYGAQELGWDISPILELDAGATGHAFRHAVGSYFVAREMPELARRMLHHAGLDTLLRVYGAGKSNVSAEDAMRGVGP